jgi:hypothetical protein
MDIVRRAVVPLRIFLVLTFGVVTLFQTLSFPGMFAHMAEEDPDLAYLRWPLVAFTTIEILCLQVIIVCTWRLLTMVNEDRIFSDDALRWVDVIIGAIVVAWVVLLAAFVFGGLIANDPGVPLLLMLGLSAGGALGLLVPVMRALLRQATTLRSDMEAVI